MLWRIPDACELFCALLESELSAGTLVKRASLTAPALSQQVAILIAGGLIQRRRPRDRRSSRTIACGHSISINRPTLA